jgi:GNAT superfamily N-acetyltransferase
VHQARGATAADLGTIARLVEAGVSELSEMKGGAVWASREADAPPYRRRLEEALDREDSLLLAGTFDGVVVGYSLSRVETLRDGSRLGVVEEIFVEAGARGVGVGEALMKEVLQWMVSRRCFGADAMALPGHRAAKNFFEESGFTARKIVMHHRIDP